MLPILKFGHPTLRVTSETVSSDDPHLARNIQDMTTALADFRNRRGWGRAIAANQVGIAKRLIVMNLGNGPQVLINPQIVWSSEETQELWDDCFSLPEILVRVSRPASISLTFLDDKFSPHRLDRLEPKTTELLHHEIDHLDGLLMTDRMVPPNQVITRDMREAADAAIWQQLNHR